jgi:protein TonB
MITIGVASGVPAQRARLAKDSTVDLTRKVKGQPGHYFAFQVDKQVQLMPNNTAPMYPQLLRSANVEGAVVGQFVVDTMGRADTTTFTVVKTTHELFTLSVKAALPGMRFSPAEIGGRKVKQLVQMPFQFNLTKKP